MARGRKAWARAEWRQCGIKGSWAKLLKELAAIARSGVAFDRDEHVPGIPAVGVALAVQRGTIYAISVPVPSARFQDNEVALTAAIRGMWSWLADVMAM